MIFQREFQSIIEEKVNLELDIRGQVDFLDRQLRQAIPGSGGNKCPPDVLGGTGSSPCTLD